MRIKRCLGIIVFALITINWIFTQDAEGSLILKFGVYTSDKPTAMVKQFRPVLNVIEKGLEKHLKESVTIKLEIAKDYETGITDIVNGKVDFSRLGPVSYIQAKKQNNDLEILALESSGGQKVFWGVICVHAESGIRSVIDLHGKSFAFGNELSTIGRYLAQLYLVENGIKASDLSRYEYLDRHDKVGAAVSSKLFDAGALKESTFKKMVAKGAPLVAIASFPNVTKPWVAKKGLEPHIKQAIADILLAVTDAKALEALGKDGFLPGNDNDFKAIRAAIDENERFFQTGK